MSNEKAEKLKNLFKLSVVLATAMVAFNTNGQDIRYSQYYTLLPALNPAATGAFGGDYRFLADYRSSNYSAAKPFPTIFASWDQGVAKYKKSDGQLRTSYFGWGLSFLNDKAGLGGLTTQIINASISYTIRLSEEHWLTTGFRAGYTTKRVDYSGLSWGTQWVDNDGSYNPNGPTDPLTKIESVSYVPISAGLLWNFAREDKLKINAGAAVNSINQPNAAFDQKLAEKVPLQIVANAGAEWIIPNTVLGLMPQVLFTNESYKSDVTGGILVKWYLSFDSKMTHIKKSSALYGGIFYRSSQDLTIMGKFELRRNMALGMSYDIDISAVSDATTIKQRSALEIVFTYAGFFKERTLLPRKGSIEFF